MNSILVLLLYIFAFGSVFCLFTGATHFFVIMYQQGQNQPCTENAMTASPVSGLIRMLAHLNNTPKLAAHIHNIEQKLVYAGKPGGEIKGEEFLGAAQLAGIGFALFLAAIFMLTGALSIAVFVFCLVIGTLAFAMSYLFLDGMVTDRRIMISRQFPFFLDLAVMTMEAGSSFLETLGFYVDDNRSEPLAEELHILRGEIHMGATMGEALENLRSRVTSEDVRNTVNAVVQGQRMGTPLSQILHNQADSMRFRRSQMAERAAEEMKVRLQGPAILMVISVLILILGPAFLEMFQGGFF